MSRDLSRKDLKLAGGARLEVHWQGELPWPELVQALVEGRPPLWAEPFRSSRAADVLLVRPPEGARTCYLKRFKVRRERMDVLKQSIMGSRGWRSYVNGCRLEKLGIRVPRSVCWGVSRKLGVVTGSYLASEAVENAEGLDAVLVRETCLRTRRRLLDGLAREVARMHDAGAVHGDLRRSNVLVGEEHGEPVFTFIDHERTVVRKRGLCRGRVHNLVRLNMEREGVSMKERLRFFSRYAQAAGLGRMPRRDLLARTAAATRRRWKERGWLEA